MGTIFKESENEGMNKSRRIRLAVLFFLLVMNMTACNRNSSEVIEQTEKQDLYKSEEGNKDKKNDKNQKQKEDEELKQEQTQETDKSILNIYFSNDDATAFVSEEVQIDALTPEAVLNALISKGAVAADVQILAFNTVTVDNKPSVEIDFNPAFSTFVTNMGSTGEYFAIGSVCKTFLNAYNCEQIKITVEGQTLTTGHAEYPGYLTAFE